MSSLADTEGSESSSEEFDTFDDNHYDFVEATEEDVNGSIGLTFFSALRRKHKREGKNDDEIHAAERLPDGSLYSDVLFESHIREDGVEISVTGRNRQKKFQALKKESVSVDQFPTDSKEDMLSALIVHTSHEIGDQPGSTSYSVLSKYGSPLSAQQLRLKMPKGDGGLIWHCYLIPEDGGISTNSNQSIEKMQKRMRKNRLIDREGQIRPRRPIPPVYCKDFFSSLVRLDEKSVDGDEAQEQPRWIFSGVMNGWPSFTCMELISITGRIKGGRRRAAAILKRQNKNKKMALGGLVRVWSADEHGAKGIDPQFPETGIKEVRATLRAAPWSTKGWSSDSPGFVFWFESWRDTPRVEHGENIIRSIQSDAKMGSHMPICQKVHMFAHRYAVGNKKESPKDKLTYHGAVLLEWDHGQYCTVVELALFNGLSGYAGKCSWYDDKDDNIPALYKAFPPCMISPWNTTHSEIRCLDVTARNLDEFKEFIAKYTGPKLRFLDPQYTHSNDVRLCYRSKKDIARYLLNYIGRSRQYSELSFNCQTFAADLYGLLAGKKGVEPHHPLNRIEYRNHGHMFLYEPSLY